MFKRDEHQLRSQKEQRKALSYVVIGSVLAHVVGGAILGSLIIFRSVFKEEVEFEPPPEIVKTIDPRKLQHKVKVKQKNQASGRPKVQPRLTAARVSEISLPDIDIEVEPIKNKLDKSMLQNVSLSGVGDGLGSGSGYGSMNLGASTVKFFGTTDRGERIVFIIDTSRSMAEDSKGGLNGYQVLRKEFNKMIKLLNQGTFFSMVTFAGGVEPFSSELVLINNETKEELVDYFEPYLSWDEDMTTRTRTVKVKGKLKNVEMSRTDLVTAGARYAPKDPKVQEALGPRGGSTRFDLAVIAALEMKPDLIFVLSDGNPAVTIAAGPEYDAWLESLPSEEELLERQKLFEENRIEENIKRAKRGLPPKITEGGWGLHSSGPPIPPGEVAEGLKDVAKLIFGKSRKNWPRIHTVGYSTFPNEEVFMRRLAREFRGKFRRIRGMAKPVRD